MRIGVRDPKKKRCGARISPHARIFTVASGSIDKSVFPFEFGIMQHGMGFKSHK